MDEKQKRKPYLARKVGLLGKWRSVNKIIE